jgi:hypothetical protein
LLDALGAVVAVRGSEPLLRAPVEPSPEFFPDVWKPNLQGAEVVLRRLMFYAGLGDLDCRIDSGDGRTRSFVDAARGSHRTSGAAAWFWGIGDGAAWFGVDRKTLKDAEHLVAAMGHEVAHAYRRRYQVEGEPETEELRTDVTTIFLGFGILNTNASARTRTQGEVRGQRAYHQTSHTWLGYLAPESMAFLLAAQAVAQGRMAGAAAHRGAAGAEPGGLVRGSASPLVSGRGDGAPAVGDPGRPSAASGSDADGGHAGAAAAVRVERRRASQSDEPEHGRARVPGPARGGGQRALHEGDAPRSRSLGGPQVGLPGWVLGAGRFTVGWMCDRRGGREGSA